MKSIGAARPRALAVLLVGLSGLLCAGAWRPEPGAAALVASGRDCRPQQVHLALTGSASEMRVSWKTDAGGCGGEVRYSLQTGAAPPANARNLTMLPEQEDSYTADDMCSLPAAGYDFEPPHLHTVVLTDLEPRRVYEYQIGDGPARSFRAASAPHPDAGFTFVVYGDMGESEHRAAKAPGAGDTSARVQEEVLERGADMVLHMGDISYANGDVAIWDTFMAEIEPYASAAPYMIGVGNHEYDYRTGGEHRKKHAKHHKDASGRDEPYDPDWGNYGNDSGGECGVAVAKRFRMPDSAAGGYDARSGNVAASLNHSGPVESNAPFWYSYEYGSAHFVVISTEHDLRKGSDQRQWLEADLRGVDRCTTPWLIVGMHRPMYVPYPHKSNRVVGRHLQDILEDLFLDAEVDLVLTGHVHLYARTCSVRRDRCVDAGRGGITHITLGCGGRRLSSIEDDQKAWIAHAASHYGYGRVTVLDGASLTFEYVRTSSGKVKDSVRLENGRARSRACDAALRDGAAESAAAAAEAGTAGTPAEVALSADAGEGAAEPDVVGLAEGVEEVGEEPDQDSDDEDAVPEDDDDEDAADSEAWLRTFGGLIRPAASGPDDASAAVSAS